MHFVHKIGIFFYLILFSSHFFIFKCDYICGNLRHNSSSAIGMDKFYENVVVKIGQKATLPCFINNLSYPKVIWVKKGDILTLGKSKISSDNRLSIQHTCQNEWHLTIENVVPNDEGEFICKTNRNFFKILKLQVLVPPSFDDLLSTPAGNIIIYEGSHIRLKCFAYGKPFPFVKWFRWKKYENLFTEKEELNVTGNNLLISSIKRNDANIYECVAKNIIRPATNRIFSLRVQFLPTVNLELNKDFQFFSDRLTLECKIEANPIENIFWFKNGIPYAMELDNWFKTNKNLTISSSGGSFFKFQKFQLFNEKELFKFMLVFTLMNPTRHDLGEYKCCVSNNFGKTCSSLVLKEIHIRTSEKISKKSNKNDQKLDKNQFQHQKIIIDKKEKDELSIEFHSDLKDKRRRFSIKSEKIKNFSIDIINISIRSEAKKYFFFLAIFFLKSIQ